MATIDSRYIAQASALFATKHGSSLPGGPSTWIAAERDTDADRMGEYHFLTPSVDGAILVGARASVGGGDPNAVIRIDIPDVKKWRGANEVDLRTTPVPLFAVGRAALLAYTLHPVAGDDAAISMEIETLAADESMRAFATDPDFTSLQ